MCEVGTDLIACCSDLTQTAARSCKVPTILYRESLRVYGCIYSYIVTCLSVPTDEVWIRNWIYWTLTLIATNNCGSLTELHTPKITVTKHA
jgi:hypothetical protein